MKEIQQKSLSEKEHQSYRQWIQELEEEGGPDFCDSQVWDCFDPETAAGHRVYSSFTDEELLDRLIDTVDHHGKKPRFDRVHVIYRRYLQLRFKGLNNAKECARVRMKQLEERRRWPADWHTRVSPVPLLEKLEQKGHLVSAEDRELLEMLCSQARETAMPPYISISVRDRLKKLMDSKSALEMMGIPVLSQTGLKRMTSYWNEERQKVESI